MSKMNVLSDKQFYNILFIELSVNAVPQIGMFDTGASITVISASLAKQMGIEAQNTSVQAHNNQGTAVMFREAVLPSLQVGDMELKNLDILISADSIFELRDDSGRSFPGQMIFGWNAIREFHWECDMQQKTLFVSQGGTAPCINNLSYEGFPLIPASFCGKTLQAGLDVGHTATMLSSKIEGLANLAQQQTEVIGLGSKSIVNIQIAPEFTSVVDGKSITLKNIDVYPSIHGGNNLDVLYGIDVLENARWVLDAKSKCFQIV